VTAAFLKAFEDRLPRKYVAGTPAVDLIPSNELPKESPQPPPARNDSQTSLPPPPQSSSSQGGEFAEALYNYEPREASDLALYKGMRVQVLERLNADWWRGRDTSSGREGIFPSNYVRIADEKGPMPASGAPPSYYGGPQQQQQQQGYYPPPMMVTQQPPQQYPQQQYPQQQYVQDGQQHAAGGEALRKFGSKLGNAAIFGAGATIGSDIVNRIF
jgi:hypothetical protein